MDCVEKARKWILLHELIAPGCRVLAAVSGGPDSMAMLTILRELSGELETVEDLPGQLTRSGKYADGNRQVEATGLLR